MLMLIIRTPVVLLSHLDRSQVALLSLRVLTAGHRAGFSLTGLASQLFDLSSLES